MELCLSVRKGGVELALVFGKVSLLLYLIFLVRQSKQYIIFFTHKSCLV